MALSISLSILSRDCLIVEYPVHNIVPAAQDEHVAIHPKKGDGLLFWSITPEVGGANAQLHSFDPASLKGVWYQIVKRLN